MDSEDLNKQSLIYADGYSYTEVFRAPELPGMPNGSRLVSVFHAFFTAERENDILDTDPIARKRMETSSGC
ncbi:hypothetical protein CH92_13540 [Stutzerimonas stutzeri]|uniref:Uncharacterized protein n=1 Tax=Stutzerimonas stutzeri TaxID=316 RepID=W8QZP1_STUST|nr:hypothetical protein [Stutzerimonas stutzeri]AHL76060.1 hypothetical protein CH92_13540 [Stutzerimonas stutzeri]MCQ4330588.1 hypothetical protein [Stutzerimonas stutzeri]